MTTKEALSQQNAELVVTDKQDEPQHAEDCSIFTQGCCDCDDGMRKNQQIAGNILSK